MTDSSGQGGRNVLVVSTVEGVTNAVKRHVHENDAVKVVVPVVGQGLLDWLANDEKAFSHAETLADEIVVAVDIDDEELEEAIQADGAGGRRMIDGIPLRIVTTR